VLMATHVHASKNELHNAQRHMIVTWQSFLDPSVWGPAVLHSCVDRMSKYL